MLQAQIEQESEEETAPEEPQVIELIDHAPAAAAEEETASEVLQAELQELSDQVEEY